MIQLFYESSSRSLVSLEKTNDTYELNVQHDAQPPTADVPTISKDKLLLAKDDVYVVDSLRSGAGNRQASSGVYGNAIRPLLDDFFHIKHTYVPTDSAHAITKFASSLEAWDRPISVIFISGDTSVNEFINSLGSAESGAVKVFMVPAGTGNSLALSIGITDEARAIRKLFTYDSDDVRPFHIYESRFPKDSYILQHDGKKQLFTNPFLFSVVTSWAFHASLVADSDTDELRKAGIARFKIAAENNLARPQKYDGEVQIFEAGELRQSWLGPFAYFVVTPSRKFEPTFDVSPQGCIFDTNLYLIGFSSEESDSYIMDIMMEIYDGGKHVKNDKVFYDRVQKKDSIELKVASGLPLEDRRFCVDGAIVVIPKSPETPVSIRYHGHKVHHWSLHIVS